MLQFDEHVFAHVLLGDRREDAVVEDVAVLEHLDERRALVLVGPTERLLHVATVHVMRAGHEGRLGAQRHADRVEGSGHQADGRRLGHLALLTGRRELALGQAVDLVVDQQDVQVDVAA